MHACRDHHYSHLAAQALGAKPLFVHFGSVASVYAGTGLGAYAGANDFLSWFAAHQREQSGLDARAIEWTSWTGVGISRRDETLGLASWVAPLSLRKGVALLRTLLERCPAHPALLVGVDWRDAEVGEFW